jgi:catechol-2,3-dioxygenase
MLNIGLAEVVFVVKEVQMAARFYREVVGLIPQSEADVAVGGSKT